MADPQLCGRSLRPHHRHVAERHRVGRLAGRLAGVVAGGDGRIATQHPLRLADAVALEEGVLLVPGDGLAEEHHQELLQADDAVLEEDVAGDGVAGEFPGFQLHLLERRLGLGARLGFGRPIHDHAAEKRRRAGRLHGRDVQVGDLQGRRPHRRDEGSRPDEGVLGDDRHQSLVELRRDRVAAGGAGRLSQRRFLRHSLNFEP